MTRQTAPTLKTYPRYSDRQRTFPSNTGLVASFIPGKGWQASGHNLPIPSALEPMVQG